MSGFELEPVDGGSSIPLPLGETVLGRGPFLGVSDKRVSRHHGLLETHGGQLRIKPTHQNPCFCQGSLEDPPEPLEKDRWHDLQPGDLFSLLPGKHIYRVVSVGAGCTQRNSQALDEEEGESVKNTLPASLKPCEERAHSWGLNGQTDLTLSATQSQPAGSVPTCSGEKEEEKETKAPPTQKQASSECSGSGNECGPKPEPKKRVLPAWMMAAAADIKSSSTPKGDRKRGRERATPAQARKPRPKPDRDRTVSSEEESEQSEVERMPRKRAKRIRSDDGEETQSKAAASSAPARPGKDEAGEESDDVDMEVSAGEEEGPARGGSSLRARAPGRRGGAGPKGSGEKGSRPRGRRGTAEEEASSAAAGGSGPSQPKAQPRTPCPYGKDCYRKNPIHFQECSHPGDSDFVEAPAEEAEVDDDRPECPYGTACYRKNPLHKKEYKHTKDPGKRKPLLEDDDEDGEMDDDSFINDESEDFDEDSDYVPPESDDSAGEDIKRLKKEATAFLRRKK